MLALCHLTFNHRSGRGPAVALWPACLSAAHDVDVTLVNPRPTFVDRVRLHQLVAGTGDATVDYDALLGKGIELVVDSATRIDTSAGMVQCLRAT